MSYLNPLAISSIIKFKMLQDVGIAEWKKKKQGGNHSIKQFSIQLCQWTGMQDHTASLLHTIY